MIEARILAVCDDEETSAFLREKLIVEAGHSVSFEPSPGEAFKKFTGNGFDVVIVKLDASGPDKTGMIKDIRSHDPDAVIIALIEKDSPSSLRELARAGIGDFLAKPLDAHNLLLLIEKNTQLHTLAVKHRKLSQSLKEQNSSLERQNTLLAKRIEDSAKNLSRLYEDLRSTYMRTIKALAHAIDARDHYTHSHSENVSKYAVMVAEEMHLPAKDIQLITEACELHDIGKIGIRDDILIKPDQLNAKEWELMKQHPITGAQILEPLTFLQGVIDLIRQHHEHYDGSGYPMGLKGDQILLGARIIHLADAYEAMTSARSYREKPLSKSDAIDEVRKYSGKQFDPQVVEIFLRIVDKI